MEKLDFNKLRPYLIKDPIIRKNLFIGLTFILMGDSLKSEEAPKERKAIFKEVAKNVYNIDNILDLGNALDVADYKLIEYMLESLKESKDEEERQLYRVIEEKVDNITYEDLALVDLVMYFMRFNEHNITLEAITRVFYIIDKYKDTPLAEELLNSLQDVINNKDHQEISFNYYSLKEKYEENDKELLKQLDEINKQFNKAWLYLTLTLCLSQVALNGEYHKQEVQKRINLRFIEKNYLDEYLLFLKDENDLKVFIRSVFENNLKSARNYKRARTFLADILLEAEKKTGITPKLTIEENNSFILKVMDAIEELSDIEELSKKYKYFDFNLLADLLAYNKETKDFLKDTHKNIKEYQNYQKIDNVLKRKQQDQYIEIEKKFYDRSNPTPRNKPQKAPTLKELKNRYKGETKKEGDFHFNRKWALLDNTKLTANVIDMREQASNIIYSKKELTEREIKKLEIEIKDLETKLLNKKRITEKEKKKTRDSLKEKRATLKEYIELLKAQEESENETLNQLASKKADLENKYRELNNAREDLDKAIEEDNIKAIKEKQETSKSIEKTIKKLNKDITQIESELSNRGNLWQVDIYNNYMVYEKNKRNSKTGEKESYKLMVTEDYNLFNFNLQEVTNFLIYIPNIPNIEQQLEGDYITLDLEDYINFFNDGQTKINISRVRKDLLNGLIEAKKESYEYSFRDSKGVLQEGSIVLFGDVLTTEYKGKGTVKVQLGGKFKEKIKEAFKNGELVEIKREALTNSRTKVERNAKKLAVYFTRLARNEAKKGLKNGVYMKDFKIGTLLDYLVEINAIKYDTSRYNQFIREPLEYALYMGKERNYFDFKTRAFENYDKAISTLNNGANAKGKIENFEKEGITIYLNTGNVANLGKNEKAHKTYTNKIEEAKKRKEKATNKAIEKVITDKIKNSEEVQEALNKITRDIKVKE